MASVSRRKEYDDVHFSITKCDVCCHETMKEGLLLAL